MRATTLSLVTGFIASVLAMPSATAHHPEPRRTPIYPRIEVIGPLGNRLPASYRRRYNRPTNWGGKIAYKIAPTSQEAMAWHRAKHRGYYDHGTPRMETHFFYPKPYESLLIGSRPRPDEAENDEQEPALDPSESELPEPVDPELPLMPQPDPLTNELSELQ